MNCYICRRSCALPFFLALLTLLFSLRGWNIVHAATPQEITNNLVNKWQTILGPVSFAEANLFSAMTCVQPQPVEAFRPFTTERMSEPYRLDFRSWLNELFTLKLRDTLKGLKPSKYYLNQGRNEPSLLLYEFEFEGQSVMMLENFNFFLFIVKTNDFSVGKLVSREAVSDLIFKWLNVRQTNQIDIAQAFRLPSQLRIGDVFTNRSQPHLALIRGGQDHVIGFISKEGICLMVPKAQEGRAAMGFHVDFNWVNRQMFEADGTTRMDHPKYFPESPSVQTNRLK